MYTDRRSLGNEDPQIFPLALGCAAMSEPARRRDDAESTAVIHEAVERGVTLIDTADFYGAGHNEILIGQAIRGRRDQVMLSVKFNALRSPDGAFVGFDSRPSAVKNFLAYSLTRLGVDHVDIYRPARLDPAVPIEDTIGAISDLVQAGWVRRIGLSEVGPETVRRAHAVHPICDVQIEYSLMSRGPEAELLPVLEELGISLTAYGVLSHGLLAGGAKPAQAGGPTAHLPRFSPDNFERNQRLVEALSEVARAKGVKTAQLATAWVLAQGASIIPVVGARTRDQLRQSLDTLQIDLSEQDLASIVKAVPPDAVAGTRYAEPLMAMLDSERRPQPGQK